MSSIIENNKPINRNRQRSNSGSTSIPTTAVTTPTQTSKKLQDNNNNNNTREEEAAKRTKKRRPTKVGLNDTLRRIRHLIVEGRSNSEIQDILQLEERTFYRYMAKIYEIDQALFAEQEKKILATEFRVFKDRMLNSYKRYIAIANNDNIKAETRIQAEDCALDVAFGMLRLEIQGPATIKGVILGKKIFD
jgi:DNA-binding CsgD family transcriptional regulator